MDNLIRRVSTALLFLFLLIAAGTAGFMIIEGYRLIDALYMTVITVSTVGFRELREPSVAGKLFIIFLILTGVGVLFYSLGTVIEYFFGDFLSGKFAERRQRRMIKRLKDHYIVCGYGRVGREIARELNRSGVKYLIIDSDKNLVRRAIENGHPALSGNATDENTLREAGINAARGLVAATGNDAENVFITLTARSIEPEIFIVARANSMEAEEKLFRAGANRVISPSSIAGKRMAALLVKPAISDYVDLLSFGDQFDFEMEQYQVHEDSKLAGRTLGELAIRDLTGAVVVLVKYPDGRVEITPRADTVLKTNSVIIVLGTREQLKRFENEFLAT